jgi:hypothetical protein
MVKERSVLDLAAQTSAAEVCAIPTAIAKTVSETESIQFPRISISSLLEPLNIFRAANAREADTSHARKFDPSSRTHSGGSPQAVSVHYAEFRWRINLSHRARLSAHGIRLGRRSWFT